MDLKSKFKNLGIKIKENKKVVYIVIAIVLLIAIGVACFFYFNHKQQDDDGYVTPSDYVEIGDVNAPVVESKEEGRNLQEEAKKLNQTYPDVVGWLKVPGTTMDFAIFQSTNNERYLRHDRDNKETKWGEPFMDYRNNVKDLNASKNIIIYGHNTETDDNFTPLLNYKSKEFFKEHRIIEMSTIDGNQRWEIFSVYITDTNFFYIDTTFADAAEYSTFLNSLNNKSMYQTGAKATVDDVILTLSTCDYSRTNGRFVVQAKLIK